MDLEFGWGISSVGGLEREGGLRSISTIWISLRWGCPVAIGYDRRLNEWIYEDGRGDRVRAVIGCVWRVWWMPVR